MNANPKAAKAAARPVDLGIALSRLDLPESTVKLLEKHCARARATPPEQRSHRSKAVQAAAMADIADCANRLRDRFEALPDREYLKLDERLFWLDAPKNLAVDGLGQHSAMIINVLVKLEVAARQQASVIVPPGSTAKGRPASLDFSVGLVARIAFAVREAGITPSLSGKFRVACDECFSAADIPSTPEAAIKVFLASWHEDYKARGLSL